MSTCPRCRQYLGEHHRCPRWVRWRRPAVRSLVGLLGAVVGAIVGSIFGPPFDLVLIPVGAFLGYQAGPRRHRSRS